MRQRVLKEEIRRIKCFSTASTSSAACDFTVPNIQNDSTFSSDMDASSSPEKLTTTIESAQSIANRGRKYFITPKLASALDRCQLSIRDSVFILQARIEALGYYIDDFLINKSSIQRIRTIKRKQRAKAIEVDFQLNVPEVFTLHWDSKLLPALNVRGTKEERLPIVISYENKEKLLAVPKLANSSGKEQVQAVFNTINEWNLEIKVQILCCDTTSSNTGRINGACLLLEQKLDRKLLLFACRHHVYELVLKSVFEAKIHQVSTNPDIPLFKIFKENWKNVNHNEIQSYKEVIKTHFKNSEIESLLQFYGAKLQENIVRDDYRELIELSILFLGGDVDRRGSKIRPPGPMNQARWMARAIYSLKILLLSSQFKLTKKDKAALLDVCLFIVTSYVKPWMQCILAVKAPYQDLCFLKSIKAYENVDEIVSKAALNKFSQHLWYLIDEVAILSLFDDDVDQEAKEKMVMNLHNKNISSILNRYIPSKEELNGSLYGEFIYKLEVASIFFFLYI